MEGFYKIANKNGRWFLQKPDGSDFYSNGVCCVTMTDVDIVDPVGKYGGDGNWFGRWADCKLTEITGMGFNTLGSWHHPHYWGNGFPKNVELSMSRLAKKVNNTWGVGFPDVFDESFPISCHKACIEVFFGRGDRLRADPGLIGYFTDNELHWWGSEGYWGEDDFGKSEENTELVDDYIALPPYAAGKKEWLAFLKKEYPTIDALNLSWGSEYTSFEEMYHVCRCRSDAGGIRKDKRNFLRQVGERYFKTTSEILKQYDPNRLNLGCRMVGSSTPAVVLEASKDYIDANSLNFYSVNFPEEILDRVYEITGKPVMITEFSFCSGKEAGFLRNTNGAQKVLVKNQARRGECYAEFLKKAGSKPYMVGTHWFALYDYGMNIHGLVGNYGLYDMNDVLWEEFAAAVSNANKKLEEMYHEL